MIPFKVFDRKKKVTWVVLSFHPGRGEGEYLAAREDDTTKKDGDLSFISGEELVKYRMVGFIDRND